MQQYAKATGNVQHLRVLVDHGLVLTPELVASLLQRGLAKGLDRFASEAKAREWVVSKFSKEPTRIISAVESGHLSLSDLEVYIQHGLQPYDLIALVPFLTLKVWVSLGRRGLVFSAEQSFRVLDLQSRQRFAPWWFEEISKNELTDVFNAMVDRGMTFTPAEAIIALERYNLTDVVLRMMEKGLRFGQSSPNELLDLVIAHNLPMYDVLKFADTKKTFDFTHAARAYQRSKKRLGHRNRMDDILEDMIERGMTFDHPEEAVAAVGAGFPAHLVARMLGKGWFSGTKMVFDFTSAVRAYKQACLYGPQSKYNDKMSDILEDMVNRGMTLDNPEKAVAAVKAGFPASVVARLLKKGGQFDFDLKTLQDAIKGGFPTFLLWRANECVTSQQFVETFLHSLKDRIGSQFTRKGAELRYFSFVLSTTYREYSDTFFQFIISWYKLSPKKRLYDLVCQHGYYPEDQVDRTIKRKQAVIQAILTGSISDHATNLLPLPQDLICLILDKLSFRALKAFKRCLISIQESNLIPPGSQGGVP